MTIQQDRAAAFHALHIKGTPLILFNIWDAGSAVAVAKAGGKALATGSRSVAGALGYDDGEVLPLAMALANVAGIVARAALPVTLDFEGAYARDPDRVAANTAAALETGVIGFNFEDQIVGGEGLYSIPDQSARIAAMRGACDAAGVYAFINARTDVFLKASRDTHTVEMIDQALTRAIAYQEAGASGFFAPGLADLTLITQLCAQCPLPINIMASPVSPSNADLAKAGVSRISYGPRPWAHAMMFVEDQARQALG
jgi:2-methylisocitrate lyase-like PEP mutase family enzyme